MKCTSCPGGPKVHLTRVPNKCKERKYGTVEDYFTIFDLFAPLVSQLKDQMRTEFPRPSVCPSSAILSACAPPNDFDRAGVPTLNTQSTLAPSQAPHGFSLRCRAKNNSTKWCERACANSLGRGCPALC